MENINLEEVKKEALNCINLLKNKKIDVKEAQEIRNLLNTIINVNKVQIEFIKSLSETNKENLDIKYIFELFGAKKQQTLSETLKEIEERRSKPYEPTR
jgi:hypothetical protein